MKRSLFLCEILLLALLVSCADARTAVVTTPQLVMSTEDEELQSPLHFEPDHIDMGSIKEGEKAVAYLRVRNSSSQFEQITKVQTSCGCSVAKPESYILMPGSFTRIQVVIDTFAKREGVKKWVIITDGEGRSSRAWLTLNVKRNPHLVAKGRSIFDGKCASCHAQPAEGLVRAPDIFAAVCAMCHGDRAVGGYAPSLRSWHDAKQLARVIAEGTGSQHMPAFLHDAGGPLSRQQIASLSGWLSELDGEGKKHYKSDPQ